MAEQPAGRMPAVPDVVSMLATLTEKDVRFVAVGGLAVAHHGYVRATKDVDIVPQPDPANLDRLWRALVAIEARPLALDHFRRSEMPVELNRAGLRQGGNWDLATRYGRLDILQYVAGKLESADDYRLLELRADRVTLDFGIVLFASYADIIDFKSIAGRDQDLIDIRALREAREGKRP